MTVADRLLQTDVVARQVGVGPGNSVGGQQRVHLTVGAATLNFRGASSPRGSSIAMLRPLAMRVAARAPVRGTDQSGVGAAQRGVVAAESLEGGRPHVGD